MRSTKLNTTKGFSLVEVVIAMGIVAILLTTFFAVFTPAQRNIQRSLGIKDANRMASALENEMAVLRPGGESSNYSSAFDKAFEWIKNSNSPDTAVLVYQYTAVPSQSDAQMNPDGTPQAYNTARERGVPGKDYITFTAVRSLKDSSARTLIEQELVPGVVTGGVYVVRMTQLVPKEDGSLGLGSEGQIVDPDTESGVGTSDDYQQAYVAFQADFFRLKSNQAGYVLGGSWNFDNLGKAVASRNMAVRR
ncbi:hypothetical protein Rhal01_01007 [Rubritalea halochordaticola]|uniref:Prepilin-type N-terminal cleavage/methylation domain-containing protein n=1 Tax=Rubritalea halochordaticola TaxID=714537 RepID=A0ABP9UWK0_9BACT